ncbi:hypothetical protein [Aeromonas jandaei]|uniref:hypothetical protein n=1 Tax=Aeromonas jandaei TaxID=650 RepID=UPI001ADDE222|nr:hypothetical protein [Aeromonas jandaei]QTL95326.1 hypothetical protein AjGTCBM29_03235 [Aeromonas jandaei]
MKNQIDLDSVQLDLDTSVSALQTLSYLLASNAEHTKTDPRFDPVTLSYGVSGLLTLVAGNLHVNSGHISELSDQLNREGGMS